MSIIHGTIGAALTTAEPRYGRTASGYGRKIPMRYMVQLAGDTRWRRVYAMCYGNAASVYVVRDGETVFLSDTELEVALGR
jgi:hypothetical protein